MTRKKVFISYDHSEDVHYKRLLEAWDANTNFKFDFDNRSPSVAIDSIHASTIKASLTRMMKEANFLLVIIGKKTYTSKWVNWEIERAKRNDTKLKLAAIKIERDYTSPDGLLGVNTSWVYSFTQNSIIAALNKAINSY